MYLFLRHRALLSATILAAAASVSAHADSRPRSWLERLGIVNYEPSITYYKDFADAEERNLEEGPLIRFLPKSAKNIHAVQSQFLDIAIAQYQFDSSDLRFFEKEWNEIDDNEFVRDLRDGLSKCPWKTPIPRKARYFESSKIKRWDISGYVVIDEDSLKAWQYWSVPSPAKQSFCI